MVIKKIIRRKFHQWMIELLTTFQKKQKKRKKITTRKIVIIIIQQEKKLNIEWINEKKEIDQNVSIFQMTIIIKKNKKKYT